MDLTSLLPAFFILLRREKYIPLEAYQMTDNSDIAHQILYM